MPHAPEVRVLAAADAAVPVVLDEIRRVAAAEPRPLISFATGSTYVALLQALAGELERRAIAEFWATHLDEYVAFPPDRRGGMVHELVTNCPPLGAMLRAGAFLPVPHREDPAAIAAHEQRLQQAGGVKLQLLGIGRNGHIAFNEPGARFDAGFHATDLAESTRRDARARFRPDEPPLRAVTAGIASILAAERVVLCAFGSGKAEAVRAMLRGEISAACPASALRRHGNLLVLLDRDAANGLDAEIASAGQ